MNKSLSTLLLFLSLFSLAFLAACQNDGPNNEVTPAPVVALKVIEDITPAEPAMSACLVQGSTKGLNVKTSVVDLFKSLGKDSSLKARGQVAAEIGIEDYTGTAAQNIKLLRAVTNGLC